MNKLILGCGDVGRRIARALLAQGVSKSAIFGVVRSLASRQQCLDLGVLVSQVDLDQEAEGLFGFSEDVFEQAELYYTVAPQKDGLNDRRSQRVIEQLSELSTNLAKAVIISTTGVYGDCDGEWVTESSATNPQTERGQRRLDMEQQWIEWGEQAEIPVVILRVPGIYSFSRLPRERIAKRIPVVSPSECGYSNRIHADDLASVCIAAMRRGQAGQIFNATDGTPGKISEYLQVAANALGQSPLPEISMEQAREVLSSGMLSYLGESRKISNQKMLDQLGVRLQHPDYRQGVKF